MRVPLRLPLRPYAGGRGACAPRCRLHYSSFWPSTSGIELSGGSQSWRAFASVLFELGVSWMPTSRDLGQRAEGDARARSS
jgi:hypothetical protein